MAQLNSTPRLWGVVLVSVAIIGVGTGCSRNKKGPEAASPTDTVQKFIDAANTKDVEGAKALFTQAARDGMARSKDGLRFDNFSKQRPGAVFEVGNPQIQGEKAEVPVTVREAGKEESIAFLLRIEEGQWRITGFKVLLDPKNTDSAFAVDFEHPENLAKDLFGGMENPFKEMENAFKKGFEGLGTGTIKVTDEDRAAESFEGMNREAFDKTWKISVDVKDKPALEILTELAPKACVRLEATDAQKKALSRAITIKLPGASAREQMDAILKEVGFAATLEESFRERELEIMKLVPLPRRLPVVYAGPFQVSVKQLDEYPPYGAGDLHLSVASGTIPRDIIKAMSNFQGGVQLRKVVDTQGQDLQNPDAPPSGLVHLHREASLNRTLHVGLKNLLRNVKSIGAVEGTISVPITTQVDTMRIENPKAKSSIKAGKVEIAISKLNTSSNTFDGKKLETIKIEVNLTGITPQKVKLLAYDASKKLIGVSSDGWGSFGDGGTANYSLSAQPAALVFKIASKVEMIEYPFRIEGIPLVQADKNPEKLEALSHPGFDKPITLEYLRVTAKDVGPSEAQVRLINHGNLPVRTVQAELTYRDATGKKVGDWPLAELRPDPFAKDALPVIVGPKATAELTMNAPFFPKNATTMTIEVKKVYFIDGSSWAGKAK